MTFRFDKLTIKAQESVSRAQSLATEGGNPQIEAIHLLQGLIAESDGIIIPLLEKIGTNLAQLKETSASELERLPSASAGHPPQLSGELNKVFTEALSVAEAMKDEFVSTEHLLLALTRISSAAQRLLQMSGVVEKDVLEALQSVRGSSRVTD